MCASEIWKTTPTLVMHVAKGQQQLQPRLWQLPPPATSLSEGPQNLSALWADLFAFAFAFALLWRRANKKFNLKIIAALCLLHGSNMCLSSSLLGPQKHVDYFKSSSDWSGCSGRKKNGLLRKWWGKRESRGNIICCQQHVRVPVPAMAAWNFNFAFRIWHLAHLHFTVKLIQFNTRFATAGNFNPIEGYAKCGLPKRTT